MPTPGPGLSVGWERSTSPKGESAPFTKQSWLKAKTTIFTGLASTPSVSSPEDLKGFPLHNYPPDSQCHLEYFLVAPSRRIVAGSAARATSLPGYNFCFFSKRMLPIHIWTWTYWLGEVPNPAKYSLWFPNTINRANPSSQTQVPFLFRPNLDFVACTFLMISLNASQQ